MIGRLGGRILASIIGDTSEGDLAMTRSNGNGHSNGDREHGDPGASPLTPPILDGLREKLAPIMDGMSARLDKQMSAFEETTRETVGENLKLFRQLLTMAEDMAREHRERMEKISTPIIDQLEKQHHEIAALKARLDAVEARQAEAGKPAP